MNEFRSEYQRWYREEYLKCDSWKEHRQRILARDEKRCVLCGAEATDVHHWSYKHVIAPELVSREEDEELASVCRACHDKLHLLHDGDGVVHRSLAQVYERNLEETLSALTDAANEAVYKACMPIILDQWEVFEQFAGQVLANVYEFAPMQAGRKMFGSICEYFGFTDLIRAFNGITNRIELPLLDYRFDKATVASIWKSKDHKRDKSPQTLDEWHDGFRKMKGEILDALAESDHRNSGNQEEFNADDKGQG